jgi:hypothetical protein
MIPSAAPATDVHSRIVFDHLPKTGGTSVRMALAAALGDSGSVTETSCPHHVAIKGANGRRLLASHFWFFPGEPLAPGWLYATVLREPVERFLSQYFFYRAMSTAVLSGAVNDTRVVGAVHLDLDAYVDGPQELRLASSNVQALHYAWRHCDAPEHLAENDLIDAAIASLEGYDEVGVFPDLQPFLDNCCDRLDVARQRVAHLNATSGRLSRARVSPAVIATLVARNGADAALYKWARQRAMASRTTPPANRPSGVSSRHASRRAEFGSRHVEIVTSRCEGVASGSAAVRRGEAVVVRLCARATIAENDLTIGIAVRDSECRLVYATNSNQAGHGVRVVAGQFLQWSFLVDSVLDPGEYDVTLAIHRGLSHLDGCFHWVENAASFSVVQPPPAADQAEF